MLSLTDIAAVFGCCRRHFFFQGFYPCFCLTLVRKYFVLTLSVGWYHFFQLPWTAPCHFPCLVLSLTIPCLSLFFFITIVAVLDHSIYCYCTMVSIFIVSVSSDCHCFDCHLLGTISIPDLAWYHILPLSLPSPVSSTVAISTQSPWYCCRAAAKPSHHLFPHYHLRLCCHPPVIITNFSPTYHCTHLMLLIFLPAAANAIIA